MANSVMTVDMTAVKVGQNVLTGRSLGASQGCQSEGLAGSCDFHQVNPCEQCPRYRKSAMGSLAPNMTLGVGAWGEREVMRIKPSGKGKMLQMETRELASSVWPSEDTTAS